MDAPLSTAFSHVVLFSSDSQFPESMASITHEDYIDPQEPAGEYFRRTLRHVWEL